MSKGRPAGARNVYQTRKGGRTDEVVVASHGKCARCKSRGELGNGLCLGCWDRESLKLFSGRGLTPMLDLNRGKS